LVWQEFFGVKRFRLQKLKDFAVCFLVGYDLKINYFFSAEE